MKVRPLPIGANTAMLRRRRRRQPDESEQRAARAHSMVQMGELSRGHSMVQMGELSRGRAVLGQNWDQERMKLLRH